MKRCKLEYMIRGIPLLEQKKIIYLIDYKGENFFYARKSEFLLDMDNPSILENFPEFLLVPEFKQDYINEAIKEYEKINELCISNNIYPIFENPNNVKECERTRLDITKFVEEEELNAFFDVSCIRDYVPPIYNKKDLW